MKEEFEGNFWHVAVHHSNRHRAKIEFTSVSSDGCFLVPESRVNLTLSRLEAGEDPDIIAQSFPIEFE